MPKEVGKVQTQRRRLNPAEEQAATNHQDGLEPPTSLTSEKPKGKRKRTTNTKDTASVTPPTTPEEELPPIEWPEHFHQLEKVFKSLNTVYTFCCTRKHFATTFANIKSSVENLIKRQLTMDDIAQIKALMPEAINFTYVDEAMLLVHEHGEEQVKAAYKNDETAKKRYQRKEDVYDPLVEKVEQQGAGSVKHVLYFEFIDGELKRKIERPKYPAPKRKRRAPQAELKMPTFSNATMTTLISRRNEKYKRGAGRWCHECKENGTDAVQSLIERAKSLVPVKPESPEPAPRVDTSTAVVSRLGSIIELIGVIKGQDWYREQIVYGGHITVPERQPMYGELISPLSPTLSTALKERKGIDQMYVHQCEAINHLNDGYHVIVSTATSSGKSLIYQIPIMQALEADPDARAIYVFPTKALAQDQKRALAEIMSQTPGFEDVLIATFDGDTPQEERQAIREDARIIFTNPDMLHITIMPNEGQWRWFFKNLKYVVVDELHVYNGLFGSHMAFIMRRLRRVCRTAGNRRVQFISCSATVANPVHHMQTIFGVHQRDVKLVDQDGSPCGNKEYLVWNPPYVDPTDAKSGRVPTIRETSRLLIFLMDRGIRTICFCRIRKQVELLLKQVRSDLLHRGDHDMSRRVTAYRAGYTPQDRRLIEKEMFSGRLLGIIATNALELGIDIGSLDAVISLGFPYTLAGFRQQAGRAGRRNKDSLAILVADPFPVDQHYVKNPQELFSKPYAVLSVDIDNPLVLEAHVQCAAMEMPIMPEDDAVFFGKGLPKLCETRLIKDDQGFYHCHPRFKPHPAKHVSIRGVEDGHFVVIDITNGRNKVLEEVEPSRASFTIYEGAIYMHQGYTYLVREMNIDGLFAKVIMANVDWTTKQRDFTDVDAVETQRIRRVRGSRSMVFYGSVRVTSIVFGYFKIDKKGNILDAVDVDTPPIVRNTHGVWLDVPKIALDLLQEKGIHIAAAIHAAEHALVSLTPIYVMSVAGDVRTECKSPEKEYAKMPSQRKRPARLILYDASGATGGITAKAFDHMDDLLTEAIDTIDTCQCEEGCPECVASATCAEMNVVCSKAGASVILKAIKGVELTLDDIPTPPPIEPEMLMTGGGGLHGRRKRINAIETVIPVIAPVQAAPEAIIEIEGDDEKLFEDAAQQPIYMIDDMNEAHAALYAGVGICPTASQNSQDIKVKAEVEDADEVEALLELEAPGGFLTEMWSSQGADGSKS